MLFTTNVKNMKLKSYEEKKKVLPANPLATLADFLRATKAAVFVVLFYC